MNEPLEVRRVTLLSQLRWALALLALLTTVSVAGYMVIEHWSFEDAVYMTVITISTVGYKEVGELSSAGKAFTIGVIVVGVGGMLYTLTTVVTYVVEVQFPTIFRRRQMTERLGRLHDHYILCGFGRVGEYVARELALGQVPFVAIEQDAAAVQRGEGAGYVCLQGDATRDAVLRSARIEHAKALITTLDTDEKNLYVVLSARELNPSLHIVARATSEDAEGKLRKVGADRVLTPAANAGRRLAVLAQKPLVADFLDTVTHNENLQLLIEEMVVERGSELANRTLGDIDLQKRTGAIILAIQRKSGEMAPAPKGDARLDVGDKLVVLGTSAQLKQLEELR